MRNDFLEPSKGPGLIGWASRQVLVWGGGGLALYAVIAIGGLFSGEQTATPPVAQQPRPTQPVAAPRPATSNSLTMRAGRDGHVYADAFVNGAPLRMVVDTGATDVVLTVRDAAAAGYSAGSLSFTGRSATANGETRFAPITLREIRIGQLEIDNVRAAVVEHLEVSLLGQSFLRRLDSYEMRDGALTLNWR
ncbi:MAG TPA: TIGR02281 family clan AA aspartic protease [Stellaceae bacterium]|nr:TIGR02281 family clan AA aspartic protease [Stellaceae bacterium]